MSEIDSSLSRKAKKMLDKIRRIAKDRKQAEKEAFDKKAAKFRALIKKINEYALEMDELSKIVRELKENDLIPEVSSLICNDDLMNIAFSDRCWSCFGGNSILPELHNIDESIEEYERSLFYDFEECRFCICRKYAERTSSRCTDDWLVQKCIEHKAVAKALNDIVTGFPAYQKKVEKFVDNLR